MKPTRTYKRKYIHTQNLAYFKHIILCFHYSLHCLHFIFIFIKKSETGRAVYNQELRYQGDSEKKLQYQQELGK